MSDKKKNDRIRQFATLVYEESAAEDWRDIIDGLCIPCLVSPLHDRDVYEKDDPDGKYKKGDIKKPHYHVMFMFDGLKSPDQCKEIIAEFNGVGIEKIHSVPAYARYLCHLDSPKKAQYSPDDVECYGGADFAQYQNAGKTDRNSAIRGLIQYCDENAIVSYAELLKYCAANNEEWFDCLCSTNGTIVIREYLKSVTWTRKQVLTNEEQYNSAFEKPSVIDEMREEAREVLKLMRKEAEYREQLRIKGFERMPDSANCPFDKNVE